MSAPVPTSGKQEEDLDGRRLSTGNMLDGVDRGKPDDMVKQFKNLA